MALNIAQRFGQGLDIGRGFSESRRNNQIQGLQGALGGQIQQGGFDPTNNLDFQQLMALDPVKASQMMTTFKSLEPARLKGYHEDMQSLLRMAENGDTEGSSRLISDRLKDIEKLKGDPSGTQMLQGMVNEGRFEELAAKLKPVEQIGIKEGYLVDPLDRQIKQARLDQAKGGVASSETTTFDDLLTKANATPEEKKLAAQIKLGLAPRAVGSSAQTISGDQQLTNDVASSQAAIEGAKETSKLKSQFKLKPKISKGVALALAEANLVGSQNKEARSNSKALNVFDIAFKSLGDALGKTTTGPVSGLMPALTSSAQSAEGAVAMILPTLKSVFREAGEGTFTDSDQKLLTDMAPTRRDNPATIKFKLNAIDAIVRAKLGGVSSSSGAPEPVQAQSFSFDAQGNLIQ